MAHEPESHDVTRAAEPSLLRAALASRCPRCGKGPLFDGFLKLRSGCPACGLDYRFADAGDGPAVFVILFAGVILAIAMVAVELLYEPPYWLHALLWAPLSVVLVLGMLRPLKAALIALQYRHKAEQARFDQS